MATLIRLVSVATLGIAAWLVSVVVLVLPARDPGREGQWTFVAVAAAGLAVLSFVVTDEKSRRRSIAIVLLATGAAVLAVAAVVFGFAAMLETRAPHAEGYLFLMGVVFATHGFLVILWLGARLVAVVNPPSTKPPDRKWS